VDEFSAASAPGPNSLVESGLLAAAPRQIRENAYAHGWHLLGWVSIIEGIPA
jgi:hypothetical protein